MSRKKIDVRSKSGTPLSAEPESNEPTFNMISSEKRRKALLLMRDKLLDVLTDNEIVTIEETVNNVAHQQGEVSKILYYYNQRLKLIYLHISPNSRIDNDYLLKAIRSGEITVDSLATMKECDMNPSKWSCIQTRLAEAKQVSHGAQRSLSSLIRCKCGGQTEYTETQTRSCDEAMTVNATCIKCGKSFKC